MWFLLATFSLIGLAHTGCSLLRLWHSVPDRNADFDPLY